MTGAEVAAAARAWRGTPYRHLAATRGAGCDCLGLLRGVWRDLFGSEPMLVPPYRPDMRDPLHAGALKAAADALLQATRAPPAAGDVVLFRLEGLAHAKHCGILVAADRFIHAQEVLGVVESNLTPAWQRRVAGRYRFPGCA